MRILAILLFFIVACSPPKTKENKKRPKLVIGIVVDQMRYDYLEKFSHDFGEGGFNKLLSKGFSCKNMNYNYKPTYTGPGHASIFTGVTPAIHGVVGNNWYSRKEKDAVYCVKLQDSLGNELLSPERMQSPSFSDNMKAFFGNESKSFGISLKDRGAILPAGHQANGAYWFDNDLGKWVSSSYYEEQNPPFLQEFNQQDFKKNYLANAWSLSLSAEKYNVSQADSNNSERPFVEGGRTTFPYNLLEIFEEKSWALLKAIPQGNQMTVDLAMKLLVAEKLGEDSIPDFLSISFSATDYVGHQFGTESVEVHDTYIKLDKTIEQFLKFIDEKLGDENVIIFLTSDHGADAPRNFLKEKELAHGYINTRKLKADLEKHLDSTLIQKEWVNALMNMNVYLNESIKNSNPSLWNEAIQISTKYLEKQEGVERVIIADQFNVQDQLDSITFAGYNKNQSGDILMIEKPNWTNYYDKGSTHGSPYSYDTHVPLLFFGSAIKKGSTESLYVINNILPTLHHLMNMPNDSSSYSKKIEEIKVL